MYQVLFVSFAIETIILRFDPHSTGEVHCHHFTISLSSQMGGIYGCLATIISIEDNYNSTDSGGSHSHRSNIVAMVIGGVEHQPKGHIGHIDSPQGFCCSSFMDFHRQVLLYAAAAVGMMIQTEQQDTYTLNSGKVTSHLHSAL